MTRRAGALHGALLVVTAMMMSGCAAAITAEDAGVVRRLMPFLHDGRIERKSVLTTLGTPAASFEGGRIVVHRLRRIGGGSIVPITRDEAATDELVLTYDDHNVLTRHTLLRVR